jgi:hypothetical protein
VVTKNESIVNLSDSVHIREGIELVLSSEEAFKDWDNAEDDIYNDL